MPGLFSEIKYWINLIICPISIVLNITLFFLIKYKSSHNLKAYKKVLYLGNITDLLSAAWFFVAMPDVTLIGSYYFVFNRGIFGYFSFPLTMWLFPITLFLAYFELVHILVQFIYRYFLICRKIKLNLTQFLCLIGLGAFIILLYCGNFYIHLFIRAKLDESYAPSLKGTEWEINGKIPPFGALNMLDFPNIFYFVFASVILCYVIVIFCGIRIYFQIRSNEKVLSQNVNKYQKQISIVMTAEACIPIITTVLPILLDLVTIIFGISIPWGGKLTFLVIGFFPVINPLIKLMVISCYRRWILKILHLKKYYNKIFPNQNAISQSNVSVN